MQNLEPSASLGKAQNGLVLCPTMLVARKCALLLSDQQRAQPRGQTDVNDQTVVCGCGHLEAAGAGKQLCLHPGLVTEAALSWWSFPFPKQGSALLCPLPGMTATECVFAAGNFPLGRSRRLASWDPRDRDKQIGGRPCRWELALIESKWVRGVPAWWAGAVVLLGFSL